MAPRDAPGIAGRLRGYDRLVEVGIGRRTDVAAALARTAEVTATDVVPRDVPPGIRFVVDDVTAPSQAVYADADAIYALNLPPELHRPAFEVAAAVDAAFAFTTLGGDHPAVPATPETLGDATLFWARRDPRG